MAGYAKLHGARADSGGGDGRGHHSTITCKTRFLSATEPACSCSSPACRSRPRLHLLLTDVQASCRRSYRHSCHHHRDQREMSNVIARHAQAPTPHRRPRPRLIRVTLDVRKANLKSRMCQKSMPCRGRCMCQKSMSRKTHVPIAESLKRSARELKRR